jgi:hypothetical protein
MVSQPSGWYASERALETVHKNVCFRAGPPVQHGVAHLRQSGSSSLDVGHSGAAGPQGVDVEVSSLPVRTAPEHGPEAAVAEGERLEPLMRRLAVPKTELPVLGQSLSLPVEARDLPARPGPHSLIAQ